MDTCASDGAAKFSGLDRRVRPRILIALIPSRPWFFMARTVFAIVVGLPALAVIVSAQTARFTVVETSIPDMQRALQQRRVTSRELVQQSLTRIALYEDRLNAIIYVNPRALQEADERDRERAAGRVRGPLHGIP